MSKRSLVVFLIAFLIVTSATVSFADEHRKAHQPKLTPQNSGTTQLLIAVSPVNSRVVWAAGTGGTYVVTTDGGDNWKRGVVPGAEGLEFRPGWRVETGVCPKCTWKINYEIFLTSNRADAEFSSDAQMLASLKSKQAIM